MAALAGPLAATVVAVEAATIIVVCGAVGSVHPASANMIVARTSGAPRRIVRTHAAAGLKGATIRLRLTVFISVDSRYSFGCGWLACRQSFVSDEVNSWTSVRAPNI
jgi:hypothetical protein